MLDALWTDIRHSVRALRGSPGFSVTVTITFALAIGANATIFSALNAIVLRAVSTSDPSRLVAISTTNTQTTQAGYIYADTFIAFRAQQRSFASLSMYSGGGVFRIAVGDDLYGTKRARVFYTSLGHPDDFKNAEFRRLLANAIAWGMGK